LKAAEDARGRPTAIGGDRRRQKAESRTQKVEVSQKVAEICRRKVQASQEAGGDRKKNAAKRSIRQKMAEVRGQKAKRS
jgi:hypothetical protein